MCRYRCLHRLGERPAEVSNESISLNDLRPGGRVSVAEECIAISKKCFVRYTVVLVLNESLRLAPGAEGLVDLDSLFDEARSANAG